MAKTSAKQAIAGNILGPGGLVCGELQHQAGRVHQVRVALGVVQPGDGSKREIAWRDPELLALSAELLLLTGPDGIGKQRFGLWLAQTILCETPGQPPCGICQSCTMVLGLGHPDMHWIVPVPRPKASDPEKQVEELAEVLGQVLAERRKNPLYQPIDGLAGHFMATSRLILRRAALTPAMGCRKVFMVAEAERLGYLWRTVPRRT